MIETTTSSNVGSTSNADRNHEHLEHRANVLREKLLTTLKQIDQRWDHMFSVNDKVRKHPVSFAVAGSGLALAIAGGITYALVEMRRRDTLEYKVKSFIGDLVKAAKDSKLADIF